ncbi:MAG: hypothetical protein ACI9VR_002368 [Cognaticolwellia sp.]|jgi:hypothetical protein
MWPKGPPGPEAEEYLDAQGPNGCDAGFGGQLGLADANRQFNDGDDRHDRAYGDVDALGDFASRDPSQPTAGHAVAVAIGCALAELEVEVAGELNRAVEPGALDLLALLLLVGWHAAGVAAVADRDALASLALTAVALAWVKSLAVFALLLEADAVQSLPI